MEGKTAVSLDRMAPSKGLSRETTATDPSSVAWNNHSRMDSQPASMHNGHQDVRKVGAAAPNPIAAAPFINHFGLLDVPQPETLFSTPPHSASWRGSHHMPLAIPEAAELAPRFDTKKAPNQLIRPKAVSRKAQGEVSGLSLGNHHHQPVQMRSSIPASNMEGSATSDDHENNNSRLIPKRGQGPGLRSEGGGKIDEYLMRLLNNGTSSEATEKRTSDGTTQRHVSRLGPLAGAGVMASSVQPSGSAKMKETKKLGSESRHRQETTDGATEPKTELVKSAKTQPSIAGENREKVRQDSVSVHPTKRKASADIDSIKLETRKPELLLGKHPDDNKNTRCSIGAIQNNLKDKLGSKNWGSMREKISQQIKEFHNQVVELHHLRDLQVSLQQRAESGAKPIQPSTQEGSGGSSRPSWKTAAAPGGGPGGQTGGGTGGANIAATPSWPLEMQSKGSLGHAEAFSWPVVAAQQQISNQRTACKQISEPAKQVSQTTQLALEAQRMRKRIRQFSRKAPQVGDPKTTGVDAGKQEAKAEADIQMDPNSDKLGSHAQPANYLPGNLMGQNMEASNLPQLGMWNPFMPPQMPPQMLAAHQAMQFGSQGSASVGNLMELSERHNTAQMAAQEAFRRWSQQQQQVSMAAPALNTKGLSNGKQGKGNGNSIAARPSGAAKAVHPANIDTQPVSPNLH